MHSLCSTLSFTHSVSLSSAPFAQSPASTPPSSSPCSGNKVRGSSPVFFLPFSPLPCFYGCGGLIRSSMRVLSGPCASMHCLTVAMTPVRRLSRAARCGSAMTGWMGSNARACRIAELSAPLLRRFNLFQVDTRTLNAKGDEILYQNHHYNKTKVKS